MSGGKNKGICLKFKDWKLKRLGKDTAETWKLKMTFIYYTPRFFPQNEGIDFFPPKKRPKNQDSKGNDSSEPTIDFQGICLVFRRCIL